MSPPSCSRWALTLGRGQAVGHPHRPILINSRDAEVLVAADNDS
ncbi:hypothetical protein I546_5689 [Mycobacterium kansasii 732]|nr:hypothetical protein I546_5689 [Mycobacterium kansasii 732]